MQNPSSRRRCNFAWRTIWITSVLTLETNPTSDSVNVHLRDGMIKRYAHKVSTVRGYSIDGHALFQNFPQEDFFIRGNLHILEKALACTERRSDGKKDKVIVMYDYNGCTTKNSPPAALICKLLRILRDHFPERLEHVFVVDAPFIFKTFWSLNKRFINPITKELVSFITGEEAKKHVVRSIINEDAASCWVFDGDHVDGEVDLENSPFYFSYDVE